MDSLVSTIILVLPGFVTMIIVESIGPGNERQLSDLEKTLQGVLFNIPIAFSTWLILSVLQSRPITSFSTFHQLFMNVPFDIVYALAQLFLASVFAYLWVFKWRAYLEKFVNNVRAKRGLPDSNHQAPYEGFFANSDSPIIEIYDLKSRGICHRGILKKASSPSSSNHMILTEDDYRLPWLDTLTSLRPTSTLVMMSDGLILKKYEAADIATAIEQYVEEHPDYLS